MKTKTTKNIKDHKHRMLCVQEVEFWVKRKDQEVVDKRNYIDRVLHRLSKENPLGSFSSGKIKKNLLSLSKTSTSVYEQKGLEPIFIIKTYCCWIKSRNSIDIAWLWTMTVSQTAVRRSNCARPRSNFIIISIFFCLLVKVMEERLFQ